MADSGRCDQNSVTHFGVDWDKVVLLLAKAIKQENADVFLEVYDNLIPSNLPPEEVKFVKQGHIFAQLVKTKLRLVHFSTVHAR